MYIRRYISTS